MYLHHPQIVRAVELARGGDLGPLELVHGSFSFFLTYPNDPRIDLAMGGGSLWDVGCYPVSFARRVAGEEPDRIAAFARFDEHGVDRTFTGQLHFPGGLLAQFDSGFAAPDRQRLEVVGGDATLVLDSPFLSAPDGPPPTLVRWDGREVDADRGPGCRPGPPRGRGPHRRDPRRQPAPDRPFLEPRYDRDARRAGPDGSGERRAPEPGAGRLALARAAGAPAEEEETCRTAMSERCRREPAVGRAAGRAGDRRPRRGRGGRDHRPADRSGRPAAPARAPHFVDETAASGVDVTYDGPYPFAVGGGVAVLDCDEDGRPDLYLAGGSAPASLYRNVSPVGGALRFEPVR